MINKTRVKGHKKGFHFSVKFDILSYLRPSEEKQEEALWRSLSEVIWRCAADQATVALPTDNTYVQHSSSYYQDGITEKVCTR